MSDYYDDMSPFDEEVEAFKTALRESVRQEIKAELQTLRTSNRELSEKLASLHILEREAVSARIGYEAKLSQAEATARRTVEKEGLRKLLVVLAEPKFKIAYAYDELPKCERCDGDRRLNYKTPRGRDAYEACECSIRTRYYAVEEALVHEVTKRNGHLMAWYSGVGKYFDSDDSFGSPTVLKSPDGVSLDELVKRPHDYGFSAREDAQNVADALNKEAAL